jgi:glutaredoxin 2
MTIRIPITAAIILLLSLSLGTSCTHFGQDAWNEYTQNRVDTLEAMVKTMPQALKYTVAEMEENIAQIESDLNIVRYAPTNAMDRNSDLSVKQYVQLLTRYKKIVPAYKQAVIMTEQSVMEFKEFRKAVQQNFYKDKKEDFKLEYAFVKSRIAQASQQVQQTGGMAGQAYASFIRLSRVMNKIILEKVSEEDLPQESQ